MNFRLTGWLFLLVLLEGCATTSHESYAQPGVLPPIQTTSFDEQGRFRVNEKPFFPILLYDGPTDAASLKMFHEYGFNVLTCSKPEELDLLRSKGFYASVGTKFENEKSTLFAMGMDSPALNFKEDLLGKVRADMERARQIAPNRFVMHAIGYWKNEPAGVVANELPGKGEYEDIIQAIEVAAPYLYPVPYQPVASVGEAVERARNATGGTKPVMPILQLFAWEAKDRYPTPAELKCMVYLSLIKGANGIGYYSYGTVTGKKDTNIAKEQPELWQSVKGINAEAATIGMFLADAANDESVSIPEGSPEVKIRAARRGNSGLVLLVNTSENSKSVTIQFSGKGNAKSFKRLDGGKEITVENGKATLSLGPFEAMALWH